MRLTDLVLALLLCASATADFEDHFDDCHPDVPDFDACVRKGLNEINSYFKTGLSKYNVTPFDPFFAREIIAERGIPKLGFTLILRNVTEVGWSLSKVTKFKSDLSNYKIVYSQSFPEKSVEGNYEIRVTIFGRSIIRKGRFTLRMFDLMETTTISRLPGQKVRVYTDVYHIRDMHIHITNIFRGKILLENIVDKLINGTWQSGFVLTRGLINELVSTAFTDIFDASFHDFPFEKIFKPKPVSSTVTPN